ncbi:MAG: CbiX/SirB N-terminal domain-containing protein [Betaproteobacteria bacterium]
MASKRATVLFAHGSRDPLWSRPIEAVAARMRQQARGVIVRCAYLELTPPELPSVVAELAADGATEIVVLPMFLGVGRHARSDLPELVNRLRVVYPKLHIALRPAVGEDPRVIDLLARIALD